MFGQIVSKIQKYCDPPYPVGNENQRRRSTSTRQHSEDKQSALLAAVLTKPDSRSQQTTKLGQRQTGFPTGDQSRGGQSIGASNSDRHVCTHIMVKGLGGAGTRATCIVKVMGLGSCAAVLV